MPATTSTSSGISQRTTVYAAREMLKAAQPVIILNRWGKAAPMPKNKGVNVKFRRPIPFTPVTVPLQEGITPTARTFSYEDISTTLRQYGDVTEITDVIEDTHEDPVLNDISEQSGLNVGRSIEALTYGVLKAGTNVFLANGSLRTDVNTPVSIDRLRAVKRALRTQKAATITKMIKSSADWGSKSIEACWPAVCHTDVEADIRNLPGFVSVADYGSQQRIHETEIGTVESFRFFCSPDLDPFLNAGGAKAGALGTMVSTGGTYADVYPILIFGSESYGVVPLQGQGSLTPTIIPVGQPTKDDPLAQRGYVGWKTWFVAVILNQLWMARLEVAVTAL